ncbi:hypothetical protein ABPG77_008726 [Micractinium sp. CCAP 211/92]
MGFLSWEFDRSVARILDQLREEASAAASAPAAGGHGDAANRCGGRQRLATLPACVRRYLDCTGAAKLPRYKLVTVRQEGEFRFDPARPWQPMSATQTASPLVPALVWSASCRFKPLVGMLGADWRAAGRGGLDWRLWGWLPAVAESGPGPLDAAMLARWLAETPGFPAAMLPSRWLTWEAVPGASNEARAVVAHAGWTASGIFSFDGDGLVTSFRSDDYFRPGDQVEAGQPRRRWVVRYREHRHLPVVNPGSGTTSGRRMLVPTEADASWVAAGGGEEAYVRFRIQELKAE